MNELEILHERASTIFERRTGRKATDHDIKREICSLRGHGDRIATCGTEL